MPRPGTVKFLEDPVEFARTHPIIVDASPVNFSAPGMNDRIKWAAGMVGAPGARRHTLTLAEGLYTARLVKNTAPNNDSRMGYVLQVAPFANGQAVPDNSFPIWFLSWNSFGGQVDMHIPIDAIADNHGQDATPRFFFTTALTGCSVFVRGHRDRPEVFHSGGEAKTWAGPSINHWRDLYAAHRPGSFARGNFAEVNHGDYIGNTIADPDAPFKLDHTARVEAYVNRVIGEEVAANPLLPLIIRDVIGVGCVFGIRRDTGRWRFYLQENVRILFKRHGHENFRFVNRTLQVRQIWPRGEHAPLVNAAPKGLI